jgi:hypothetical protein
MQDVCSPAVAEAARRPTAPVGSRARTTAQPGPSTTVRAIGGYEIPARPRWLQWREPAAVAAPPSLNSLISLFSASTWLRRRSTNSRDPAGSVFCGEVGADASLGRKSPWTVDQAKVSPPIMAAPSATARRVERVLPSRVTPASCPNSSSNPRSVVVSRCNTRLAVDNADHRPVY